MFYKYFRTRYYVKNLQFTQENALEKTRRKQRKPLNYNIKQTITSKLYYYQDY